MTADQFLLANADSPNMLDDDIPDNATCIIHRQPILGNGYIWPIVINGKATMKEYHKSKKENESYSNGPIKVANKTSSQAVKKEL